MKQTIELLISALNELQKKNKTEDFVGLEEKVALIVKDLNGLIIENKYSKDDKDFKQKIDELGKVIKNIEQNQAQRGEIFTEFIKYLKDRKIN